VLTFQACYIISYFLFVCLPYLQLSHWHCDEIMTQAFASCVLANGRQQWQQVGLIKLAIFNQYLCNI